MDIERGASRPAGRTSPASDKVPMKKGAARREEVIKAAARLFRERGYHVTSMQDIANEVGLLKGSLYYYVTSKEDLLFKIIDEEVSAALGKLEDICARHILPVEKLRLAVLSLVGLIGNDPERVTLFLQESRAMRPEQMEVITSKRKRYEALFQEILEEGNRRGIFNVENTKIVSFGLLGMCTWIYNWYAANGPLSLQDIATMFTELFLSGCLRRNDHKPA